MEVDAETVSNTIEFFDFLLPPRESLLLRPSRPDENAIIQKHMTLYCKQGGGKTESANTIVAMAVKKYGRDNVSAFLAKGEHFKIMIDHALKPVLVNILILEDMTDVKMSGEDVKEFFRIRHKVRQKTGMTNGLILVIITCHRLYDLPLALRTDVDFVGFKGVPSREIASYDYHVVERAIGPYDINRLREYETLGITNPAYKGYTCMVAKDGKIGFIYFFKCPVKVYGDFTVEEEIPPDILLEQYKIMKSLHNGMATFGILDKIFVRPAIWAFKLLGLAFLVWVLYSAFLFLVDVFTGK